LIGTGASEILERFDVQPNEVAERQRTRREYEVAVTAVTFVTVDGNVTI
jgi:hypothetical protein